MKCQAVNAALEEYFDGELDEARSRRIGAHLAACADCAAAYQALQREQALLLRYERDLEVAPQLWLGVQARLAAAAHTPEPLPAGPHGSRRRGWLAAALMGPRFSPALTAALVLVAIALTVTVMKFAQPRAAGERQLAQTTSRPQSQVTQTDAPTPAPTSAATGPPASALPGTDVATLAGSQPEPTRAHKAAAQRPAARPRPARHLPHTDDAGLRADVNTHEQTAAALVREAEAKYLAAIDILARDVDRRRPQLDAEARARFADTLAAIDRTIAETRRAALRPGSDPVAAQYMLTAYAKKVEVLREMARN